MEQGTNEGKIQLKESIVKKEEGKRKQQERGCKEINREEINEK